MTEEHIKEKLSNQFLGILAATKGFVLSVPNPDYGVDFILQKSITYTKPNGGERHTLDSRSIDIQLKATIESQISRIPNYITYNLSVINYNDLIRRMGGNAPLILVLFVLPNSQSNWVNMKYKEIKLRKHAYWYYPPDGSAMSDNVATKTIHIPTANLLDINFCNIVHQRFYP